MKDEYTDEGFDKAISIALAAPPPKKTKGGKNPKTSMPGLGISKLRQMLKAARSDPAGWTRKNREDVQRASKRRIIARKLHEDVPDFTEDEHAEFLGAFQADPETQALMVSAWDEEKKAKWLKWIERAIPVLKFIAGLTPPPYNLIVFAIIVVLTLIAENRLQPAQLAEIFKPQTTAPEPESVPTTAV